MGDLPVQRPTESLAHLAWCILTAVALSRREGKVASLVQQHLFIMQWLATAQKRKLFPKNLAPDILWLQAQGQKYGPGARLYRKVEYIWLASSGELAQQSTLFRFTYVIDILRTMGWQDYLLPAKDWEKGVISFDNTPAIYTPKDLLHPAFSNDGKLIRPLPLRFTGDISGLFPILTQCHLSVETLQTEQGCTVLQLLPDDSVQ